MAEKLYKDHLTGTAEWERFEGQIRETQKALYKFFVDESAISLERVHFLRGQIQMIDEILELPNTLFRKDKE